MKEPKIRTLESLSKEELDAEKTEAEQQLGVAKTRLKAVRDEIMAREFGVRVGQRIRLRDGTEGFVTSFDFFPKYKPFNKSGLLSKNERYLYDKFEFEVID